jgi:apolipoprotein N-acyltransferase
MAGKFTGEAGAALVFLIAYLCVFSWMLFAYFTKRIKVKSRWSLLFFHVTVRVASQACGIGFGVLGFSNTNLFLAYLILGAEGYFTLVLCTFRFLVSWHEHNLPNQESWLEPRRKKDDKNKALKIVLSLFLGPIAMVIFQRNFMTIVHFLLILANAAIVVGGSYLAGADYSNPTDPDTMRRMNVAKITRTAGQSVFLACNAALMVAMLITARNDRKNSLRKRIHPTLIILLITWFPLIIRGIFGVLQSAVWDLSYYNPNNYESTGFTSRFTAIEYVLGVLTEWLACALLNTTWFTSRNDPPKRKVEEARDGDAMRLSSNP